MSPIPWATGNVPTISRTLQKTFIREAVETATLPPPIIREQVLDPALLVPSVRWTRFPVRPLAAPILTLAILPTRDVRNLVLPPRPLLLVVQQTAAPVATWKGVSSTLPIRRGNGITR